MLVVYLRRRRLGLICINSVGGAGRRPLFTNFAVAHLLTLHYSSRVTKAAGGCCKYFHLKINKVEKDSKSEEKTVFIFQMVQTIQVLRLHLMELEKVGLPSYYSILTIL